MVCNWGDCGSRVGGECIPVFRGRSNWSVIGSISLILHLDCSTPSAEPAIETWLDFSAVLVLFESGKWMWHPVSSMTLWIERPPLPMICEWSVKATSIFNVTRLRLVSSCSKMISFADLIELGLPVMRTWGSFLDLVPGFSLGGHMICVFVDSITRLKKASASQPIGEPSF